MDEKYHSACSSASPFSDHTLLFVDGPSLAYGAGMVDDPETIAARLKRLRSTLGLTQEVMCQQIGISQSRYSNYEAGSRPLTLDVAARLVHTYGITFDWVYFGATAGLPMKFVKLA